MAEILEVALIVISVLLIALVLLQSNKASDASQIITGGNAMLMGKSKERGAEKVVSVLTLVCAILFFFIAILIEITAKAA